MHNLKERVTLVVSRSCLKWENFTVLVTHRTPSGTGPEYYQLTCVVCTSNINDA